MTTYYIRPVAAGTGDGSSWANAAALGRLPTLVEKAGAGSTILLRADEGAYAITESLNVWAGGSAGNPITIKGVDANGSAMNAVFVGTRAAVYSPTADQGTEVFRLLDGASHLVLENMDFRNVNNAIRLAGNIGDITVAHMQAENVSRFIDNLITGSATAANVTGLTVRDVAVTGFAKDAIRLQYDSHDVTIDRVAGDSRFIDGADFAMGIALDGTAHNITISNTSMGNALDTTNAYHNGDGFVTEANVYDVHFINTYAYNNSDGGYDLKSSSTTLDHAIAEGNTRNFRFWNTDTVATDITGIDPVWHGGTSSVSNVWLATNAHATISKSSFYASNTGQMQFDLIYSGSSLTLNDVHADSTGANTVKASSSSHVDGAIGAITSARPHWQMDAASDQATTQPTTGTTTASAGPHGVFRFYDTKTGDHFYTTSSTEKAQIQAGLASFQYEGAAWATPDKGTGTLDVYRFLDTVTGDHFYTTSAAERDGIRKGLPSFQYEGVAFQAYASPEAGTFALERFYNTATGQHHFATPAEADGIRHGSAGANWVDEGKGFTVHDPSGAILGA